MNVQLKILLYNLKKSYLWIIILFLLMILSLIFYSVRPLELKLSSSDFIELISYPRSKNISFVSLLVSIYQIGLTIYYIYIYYSYELENSFDNIVIRSNEKKWIFQKIVGSIIFIILFRLIYTGLLYIYFYEKIPFELNFLVMPIIYHILISLIIITILNYTKFDNGIKLLISVIISFFFFLKFNVLISLFLIIIIIIFNCIFFRFKRYYN